MQAHTYSLSAHAMQRMAQRNLSAADIVLVLQHGQIEHRAGVKAFFLGRRQLALLENSREVERLEGTVVLWAPDTGEVVTVYRNRYRGLKDHRRKHKRDYQRTVRS